MSEATIPLKTRLSKFDSGVCLAKLARNESEGRMLASSSIGPARGALVTPLRSWLCRLPVSLQNRAREEAVSGLFDKHVSERGSEPEP